MGTWLADNWYVITGIVGGVALIAYRVHERGGDEPLPRRVLYVFAPIVDPKSERKLELSPLALVLWMIGMIILVVAFLIIDRSG